MWVAAIPGCHNRNFLVININRNIFVLFIFNNESKCIAMPLCWISWRVCQNPISVSFWCNYYYSVPYTICTCTFNFHVDDIQRAASYAGGYRNRIFFEYGTICSVLINMNGSWIFVRTVTPLTELVAAIGNSFNSYVPLFVIITATGYYSIIRIFTYDINVILCGYIKISCVSSIFCYFNIVGWECRPVMKKKKKKIDKKGNTTYSKQKLETILHNLA